MKKTKKVRKIGQNEASQEEKYNDKSTIHLPRQSVADEAENQYLQWFQSSEQMNFHTFPTIMSLWHSTNDFPLTAVGGIFLWEIEVGQKWPGSDFWNIKATSGHFPYSSWENIVDYISKAFFWIQYSKESALQSS